ncbi:competence protein CoiA family protein [Comamonas antarctica]|uniref:Competence protein CoiA nuclease-like domain-containing protein n=1 Tax=Comamonas antarctica TaxID=2743470 RepID=A0A6N1X7S3_9BURK|nr:competence protein CoiA family protein [Comamonas antarctica]QKV55454.1 hypothetical protein HUK68_21290 [Comamonas antarctica]
MSYQTDDWERMKATSNRGSYVMSCCKSPAVLKTSILGIHFFSHVSDECFTAPETIWHRDAKSSVVAALDALKIKSQEEVSGVTPDGQKWRADVFFEHCGRRFAIELQHTPQTLSEFMRRQQRYEASSVKCYWVVRTEVFLRLQKATVQYALKRFHGGKLPVDGVGTGAIPELPVAMLQPGTEQPMQFGLLKASTITTWILALLENRYKYFEGSWYITEQQSLF